jgi:pimeloyl-ACP methyl ester carboxylesterase
MAAQLLSRREMYRLIALTILLFAPCSALAQTWPSSRPDPCTNVRDRGALERLTLGGGGGGPGVGFWDVTYPEAFFQAEDQLSAVVFIVNANGATSIHYQQLADHLARQNYLVRIIQRPGGTLAPFDVESAMAATFTHFALPADFPVVLIGHSMGGGSVMEVTRLFSHAYNIDAVVGISPNVTNLQGFMGTDAPAYLALYGSQDEDMSGTAGAPREAFMGYDLVNIEATTASSANRFIMITPNMVDKAMVYVRGADHSGFIRAEGLIGAIDDHDYLSVDNQFCIAKAYVTGFLEWKLMGNADYRPMFYGDEMPPSVAQMTTSEPDYFGNPAGEPVQLFHQISPRKRFVIADFSATPAMSVGADVFASVLFPNTLDVRARHFTKSLRLAWKSNVVFRNVQLTVPAGSRNLAAFDRLQLRIGQIDTGDNLVANTLQHEPPMMLSLVDGQGQVVTLSLNSYGRIPGPDLRSGGISSHSHMNTISIPMDDLDSIQLSDVRLVRFWVFPGTRGEVMIDNIEAVYDF